MLINLGRDVDGLLFGMSEPEIVGMLGEPDKIWFDANDGRNLEYHKLKLVLKIEPNERLGWIEVHNQGAIWNGINPWAISRDELLDSLSGALGEEVEFEDYGGMESYFFHANWVELQYEVGALSSFNFGVLYHDNEEQLWPKGEF
jgi:hypothetical protein